MEPRRRLLIIAADAGSASLFRRWSAGGELPNFRAMMSAGQWRTVETPHALEAGAVWPAFHTGLLPGRQPQYDGMRGFIPHDYSVRCYEPGEAPPTVWQQLSRQGVRCLLVDPPCMHLDPSIHGTMVIDWGSHSPANGRTFRFRTRPAEVAEEILTVVGRAPAATDPCDRMSPETLEDHEHFRDLCVRRIGQKGKLAAHLLVTRPWQLALVACSDLHCAGHHLWHVNDPSHPRYSARLQSALGDPLRDCYRAFDRALGTILTSLDGDTTVLLYGSLGIGPAYGGAGLLDRMLLRLDRHRTRSARRLPAVGPQLGDRLPVRLRERLAALLHERGRAAGPRLPASAGRRFFEVHTHGAGSGIRLNLKGREGRGTVEPEEAEGLVTYLIAELGKVVDARTGEPAIEEVLVAGDRYRGPHANGLPDLLVRWNARAPMRKVRSETLGELCHEPSDHRSGGHTPDGFCIASGAGVTDGSVAPGIHCVDFAPTVASFFGCRLSCHDGRPFDLAQAKKPEQTVGIS